MKNDSGESLPTEYTCLKWAKPGAAERRIGTTFPNFCETPATGSKPVAIFVLLQNR